MVIVDGRSFTPGQEVQRQIDSILEQEGVRRFPLRRGLLNQPIDASLKYMGFILEEGDPRLAIVHAYEEMERATREKPTRLNLENALTATYLSKNPSRRNGYPTTLSEVNIRQQIRAMHNLKARPMLEDRFAATQDRVEVPEGYQCMFAVTDSIRKDTTINGVTACPEALYQLRLFDHEKYIGRVGFNIHEEMMNGKLVTVASITNIQGIPDGKALHDAFKERAGIDPFNFLVRRLWAMAEVNPGKPISLRGLKNPRNESSTAFYNSLFKREKVPTFAATRG